MAKIKIDGREYMLRMDIYAMEKLEKEYGDLKSALELFRKGDKKTGVIKDMFRIMANSGQHKMKQPEDVTGDELDGMTLADMNALSIALNETMEESMHAETVGGNEADDEVHDEYMEELENREKNA